MKHAFIIASLLLIQTSAFALEASKPVNAEPSSKETCWRTHATSGQLEPQRLIRPVYVQPVKTFEQAAGSQRTI